jgi:ribose-phosphate pyrophosphokinase
MYVKEIHIVMPYFPGGRQDRVMVAGESLTVKVYADIINALQVSTITILDPHSDVTSALLDNCVVLTNHPFIDLVQPHIPDDTILISPDAGASKKISALAKRLGISLVLECGKKRDTITGKLSGFNVPAENLKNKPCLIVDDICDGGGTFLGLGEELKKKNSGDLFLAVSHGIFSKGLNHLSETFKQIFTTDSISSNYSPPIKLITFKEIINHEISHQ